MVTIVAEIGVNHFGDMELAKELIKQAKECGANLAKFQLYDVDKVFPDKQIITQGKNRYEDVKKTQLSKEQARMLFDYGEAIGIEVFFSVFDIERVGWCEEIGVKRYKIAYNQRNNKGLIKALLKTSKTLIASMDEYPCYGEGVCDWKLYCLPFYPTPSQAIRWDVLKKFGGFSDHTVGIETSKRVLDLGVGIVEKHFCLNKEREGADIPISITPEELSELVEYAKNKG